MLNHEQLQDHDSPAGMPLLAAADLQDNLLIVSNDLERLQRLLGDATESLMAHFHGASDHLNELMKAGSELPDVDDQTLRSAIRHLGGAVTALQFQDMSSQLIVHLQRRLHRCVDRLARETMGDDEDGTAVVEEEPLRPNPVTQDEVDAGSIELF